MYAPLPLVSSVDMSAAGPDGRGRVVVVAVGADTRAPLVLDAPFLLLEQAASPTSATATAIVAACSRRRDTSRRRSTVVMHAPGSVAGASDSAPCRWWHAMPDETRRDKRGGSGFTVWACLGWLLA